MKITDSDILKIVFSLIFSSTIATAWCGTSDRDSSPGIEIALKSNLLHDLAITPDVGVEISFKERYSVSLEGVYAWWGCDTEHRYWRIRGAQLEMRLWFGDKISERAMTGHHIGVYGLVHDYDFEFGGKGWQSPHITYGIGVNYGYSLRLNSRLNLDLNIQIGYSSGTLVKYKPQCGQYVCTDRSRHRYFGPTGVGVTLVWFPGKGNKNNPNRGL